MPARLLEAFATTTQFADLFSDQSLLQAMLDFEVALARAEVRQAKGIRYRSGVHGRRIRIPKGLQPRVSQFVRASI